MKNLTLLSVLTIALLYFLPTGLNAQNIHCTGPFGGSGAIGEPALWTLIGQVGNPDDVTSYGGVNYSYSYFDRFVRIDDYLVFLNAVDPGNTLNFEGRLEEMGFIEYSGGNWHTINYTSCSAANGQNIPAATVGRLAVSWISFNQAARFANWVATGSPNTGAYSFVSSDGNANVSAIDLSFVGVRLPTEDEFYKAAYYNPNTSTYSDYGTTVLDGAGEPLRSTVSSTGMLNTPTGHAYDLAFSFHPGIAGEPCLWQVQAGQGGKSAYGLFNMVGGFHHYLTDGSSTPNFVVRPNNQVEGGVAGQHRNYRRTDLDPGTAFASPSLHLVIVGNACGGAPPCPNPNCKTATVIRN